MADSTTKEPKKQSPAIEFVSYHKPAMASGRFQIKLEQQLEVKTGVSESFNNTLDFFVAGERFAIKPDAIYGMYPPAGSFGHYSNCLPHVSLKQSTFAWQRSAYAQDDTDPWLALLLFDQQEIANQSIQEKIVPLSELQISLPTLQLEPGQTPEDKISVIDVRRDLLEKIMPDGEALKLLAHVRTALGDDSEAVSQAVIMSQRLPKEGADSAMYLVSVEDRFDDNRQFDFGSDDQDGYIRLVSLHSWQFSCEGQSGKGFEQQIKEMKVDVLRLPNVAGEDDNSEVNVYLQNGYVPLFHRLRQCDTTWSWYRSPLATTPVPRQFYCAADLPDFADALTCYHQDIGMFDMAYCAAYELGRSLALQDKVFSADLYRWKQHYNLTICQQQQQARLNQLSTHHLSADEAGNAVDNDNDNADGHKDLQGEKIKRWLSGLARLKEVPFNYLVPDEKMLGSESLKFFTLDQHWLECLLYGALSIGGVLREKSDDANSHFTVFNDFTQAIVTQPVSGFILRSTLVADYPDLLVDGYSETINSSTLMNESQVKTRLPHLRLEPFGSEMLFCLFDGEVATAELYLKPEGLHFGLDVGRDNSADHNSADHNSAGVTLKKELATEDIFNAVTQHLDDSLPVTMTLAQIKQAVANKSLLYQPTVDEPSADGGKLALSLFFKSGGADARVLDILALCTQLKYTVEQMASKMTGKTVAELPEILKTASAAQLGLYMLEGSNKGRFVRSGNQATTTSSNKTNKTNSNNDTP